MGDGSVPSASGIRADGTHRRTRAPLRSGALVLFGIWVLAVYACYFARLAPYFSRALDLLNKILERM